MLYEVVRLFGMVIISQVELDTSELEAQRRMIVQHECEDDDPCREYIINDQCVDDCDDCPHPPPLLTSIAQARGASVSGDSTCHACEWDCAACSVYVGPTL